MKVKYLKLINKELNSVAAAAAVKVLWWHIDITLLQDINHIRVVNIYPWTNSHIRF